MSENTLTLKSGLVVHWKPVSEYIAELDLPLGMAVCRLCCERENGKENAVIGLIAEGRCSHGCFFPKLAEQERIRAARFLEEDAPVSAASQGKESLPQYDRHRQSPFRKGSADDRLMSALLSCGKDGIKMEDLYSKTLPFFPDKNEKTIKTVCSSFVCRFGKPNNDSGFEIVWDRPPKRGPGSNAGERRIGLVFADEPWPTWAIKKS